MPKFQCPSCNRTLRADDSAIGKTAACPCGKKLRVAGVAQNNGAVQPIPAQPVAAQPIPAQPIPAQPIPAQPVAPSAAPSHISIQCSCGKRMRAVASARGKQVRCPECQSLLTVGGAGPVVAMAEPGVFGAGDPFADTELPDATSSLSQQSDDWLGSLPPAEAAPTGALDQDFSSSSSGLSSQYGSGSNYQASYQESSANRYLANAEADMRQKQRAESGADGESSFWDAGTGMGALMMVGAVVWFFGGLALGILFYYPPILFIAGLISFVRGLLD